MDEPRIPIRNLYYLLCYAWNHLQQGELADVSRLPSTELVDLFTLVLCDGIEHLARRGLEQGYELKEEDIAGVRGRMDILQSTRRFLLAHGRAACRFDELSVNTVPNQILKSTLGRLECARGLDARLRKRVHAIRRGLHGISEIPLSSHTFRTVQLHGNNRFYRFLLNVCQLIHEERLPDREGGAHRFREFVRDERIMARVFENFLLNFIRIEIPCWTVSRERFSWEATSRTEIGLSLLPCLETDVSLRRGGEYKIIEAKYYQETLVQRHGAERIRSGHLYQLLAYLANAKKDTGDQPQGLLLYPRVDQTVRAEYVIQGYEVTVATVDLDQPWEVLKQEIIGLIT